MQRERNLFINNAFGSCARRSLMIRSALDSQVRRAYQLRGKGESESSEKPFQYETAIRMP